MAALAVATGVCALAALLATVLRWQIADAVIVLGFLSLGGFLYAQRTEIPRDDLSLRAPARAEVLLGVVADDPRQTAWGRRVRLRVEGARIGGAQVATSGLVEAILPLDPPLRVGDRVALHHARVELPPTATSEGEFDYRQYLALQGVRAIVRPERVEVVGAERTLEVRLRRVGLEIRRRVVASIDASMPGIDARLYSRLLVGMVYGLQAGPLPDHVVESFRRAGTVHLLVVSGAQVSMVAIAIIALTGGSRRILRWWQALLAVLAVGLLLLIVGIEASISRAVGMFALFVLAALTRRDYDVLTAIGVCAAVICVFDPYALLTLSFQLTFAATVGVVAALPREALCRVDGTPAARSLRGFRTVVWGTFGAWLATAPLLAASVSGFALSGNVANLANVPLSVPIMLLGFLAMPLALIPGGDALLALLCWLARLLLQAVIHVNELVSALPTAFVSGLRAGTGECALLYLLVATAVILGGREALQQRFDRWLLGLHPRTPLVTGVAVSGLLVSTWMLSGAPVRGMELTLLPVGAGQCAVVRSPDGHTVMIDCGGGGAAPRAGREIADGVILPWLARRGIERLDAVVISHWDADHCNALRHIARALRIDTLVVPPLAPDHSSAERLLEDAWADHRVTAQQGAELVVGDVVLQFLEPRQPYICGSEDDGNNNAIVCMVEAAGRRVLLPADIMSEGLARLMRDVPPERLRCDALVLPHHGRRIEATLPLVDLARPRLVAASCDSQAEDYMQEDALARLRACGIGVARTDRDGAVTFVAVPGRVDCVTDRENHVLRAFIAAARG